MRAAEETKEEPRRRRGGCGCWCCCSAEGSSGEAEKDGGRLRKVAPRRGPFVESGRDVRNVPARGSGALRAGSGLCVFVFESIVA